MHFRLKKKKNGVDARAATAEATIHINIHFYIILQTKTPSLWLCYLRTHWKMFAFGGILKLLGDLAALVGPLSITLIVEYIEMNALKQKSLNATDEQPMAITSPTTTMPLMPSHMNFGSGIYPNGSINLNLQYSRSDSKFAGNLNGTNSSDPLLYYPGWSDFIANGWIMGVLVLFASLAQGSLSQMSTHIVNMVGIRLRTSIQSLVYRKMLLISSSCFFTNYTTGTTATETTVERKNSNGQTGTKTGKDDGDGGGDGSDAYKQTSVDGNGREKQFIDVGTITNLMSDDALNVMSFLWIAHYVWAIPLKVRYTFYTFTLFYLA